MVIVYVMCIYVAGVFRSCHRQDGAAFFLHSPNANAFLSFPEVKYNFEIENGYSLLPLAFADLSGGVLRKPMVFISLL